jgi:hypothetical protein
MFLDLPDPDPSLFLRMVSFHHEAKIVRKTLISTVLQLPFQVTVESWVVDPGLSFRVLRLVLNKFMYKVIGKKL